MFSHTPEHYDALAMVSELWARLVRLMASNSSLSEHSVALEAANSDSNTNGQRSQLTSGDRQYARVAVPLMGRSR